MVALGGIAYAQPPGDPVAVQALGRSLKNLPLAGGELPYGLASCVLLISAGVSEAQQFHDLF